MEDGKVLLDGRDVSTAIREPDISTRASVVSAMPAVRAGLLGLQRSIARAYPRGAVLEGRDIGTVVFPNAQLKIYPDAGHGGPVPASPRGQAAIVRRP